MDKDKKVKDLKEQWLSLMIPPEPPAMMLIIEIKSVPLKIISFLGMN